MTDPNEALVEAIYADIRSNFMNDSTARSIARFAARAIIPIIEAERQAVKEACAKVVDRQIPRVTKLDAYEVSSVHKALRQLAAAIRALDLREIG